MTTVDHTKLLLRLHPVGAVDLRPGSTYLLDLEVLGAALDLAWEQATQLEGELLPDHVSALLSRWEATYGINRVGSRTDTQRRDRLIARRRFLPDFRPATIEDLVEQLTGIDVDLLEPDAFRCDDAGSLTDDGATVVLDGHFCFIIDMSRTTAAAASVDRDEVAELLDELKPAHTIGGTRFDDFRADDPYSLTDRDTLAT